VLQINTGGPCNRCCPSSWYCAMLHLPAVSRRVGETCLTLMKGGQLADCSFLTTSQPLPKAKFLEICDVSKQFVMQRS
jgi:hypothetical protein